MQSMAAVLAKKQIFGIKDPDHILALMLVAQAEGLHPATVVTDYDFIQGRPAKKPAAMLRDFIRNGGTVTWHKLDDTEADGTFSHKSGGTVRVRWDMRKASQAGLSSKESWKKYPSAMLRSRVVSEAMRAVYPGATGGLYTPEEVQDMAPSTDKHAIDGEAREVTEDDVMRRDEIVQKFTTALGADVPEEEKARMVYDVHSEIVGDEEFYRFTWSAMDSLTRRAIKAYVEQHKGAQPTVLANGRAA
jgi:hypothetical protein